jgi:LysR family glycine cleavage system transcriptional activator
MSFSRAADELNVTPAALSFQIKSLEDHLGQPVFHRLNRAVELTEVGRALVPGTREGFRALTAAWAVARRLGDQRVLTITAGPAFTALWLAPRMFSFATAHPDIELRFSASLNLVDFDRDGVDVAIRFGQGDDAGLFSVPLAEEWLTPMMTPAMAADLSGPEDLRSLTLLHDDMTTFIRPHVDWGAWFRAAQITPPEFHGPRFNQADHAIGAAVAGVGAIMGRVSLTETALRDGRLVMPFDLTLKSGATYRIVCPQGAEKRPQVAAFISWVKAEVSGLGEFAVGRRFVTATEDA